MRGEAPECSGVLEVAITNSVGSLRRDRLLGLVAAALSDERADVRDEAAPIFYREFAELSATEAEQLIKTIAQSGDAETAGPALHALRGYRRPLPSSTLDLCEQFLRRVGAAASDPTSSMSIAGTDVITLAVRLHAQSSAPEIRSRCLDLIDTLVELRAHGIDSALAAVDR